MIVGLFPTDFSRHLARSKCCFCFYLPTMLYCSPPPSCLMVPCGGARRGPFTPDFVKKAGGKPGWDPFVTKIRKSSVVASCAGLLCSRCIPEKTLKELGV